MKDLERERDYYRRTCDEMGMRLLQLQEEQARAHREARRSRVIATLIREVYQLADTNVSFNEIGQRFLCTIIETLSADKAAVLQYDSTHHCWRATHLLGFKNLSRSDLNINCQPSSFLFSNSSVESDPILKCLCEKAGADYLLWASDLEAGLALMICNETEDQYSHRPFEEVDREIVEGPLQVFIEITERKQAEEHLKASLNEKEILLKELYHRTKNNMQVIRSMLALQANASSNEEVQKIFHDTENRIFAMSLVHQKLYQSQSLSSINIKEYMFDLSNLLLQSYHISATRIFLDLKIEDFSVSIDTAIPCGLVLNELLSNALKYAFPDEREGEICIQLSKSEDNVIHLNFSDNGVGVPENFDLRQQKTLGIKSMFTIVEHQLQGNVTYDVKNGVAYDMHFEDKLDSSRKST